MTQSVVSAYESGGREPSLPMLVDLVHAAGLVLDVRLAEPDGSADRRLQGVLGRRVRRHARRIRALAAGHGVGLFALGRLKDDLERLLRVPVDVVPADSLKPDARADVARDAVALCAR